MQPNYYVTEVSSEEDLAQAISIWERNLSAPVGTCMEKYRMKKYRWFYETNPYRKGRLWLLKLKGSENAVGAEGVGYRRFILRGKSFIGGIGVDLAVEKGHRALGPALQLHRTIIESAKMDADFLYSFPNKQAEAVLNHFGYHKVAEFTRLVKFLKSGDYLERVVKPRFLARSISFPVDFVLWFRLMKSLSSSGNEFHSDNLEGSYSFYDLLWEHTAREGFLVGERTSTFLDWRYFKCPGFKYEIFGVKDNNHIVQGFVIYYLRDKRVQVVDLICPQDEKGSVMESLIRNFEKHCFLIGVTVIGINLIGAKNVTMKLRSMGYWYNRKQQNSLFVFTGGDEDLLAQFKHIENSYWTWGDLQ